MNNTTGYGDVSVENGHTHSIDISAYTTNDSLDLIFYFVKKETGTTEHMDLSIEALKERLPSPECAFVVNEAECLNIPKAQMRETKHVFIFDDFDKNNAAFNYIFTANNVYILGTKCLTKMLLGNVVSPGGLFHIHNLAMRDLIICPSGLQKEQKKEIKELVNFMGGYYTDSLKDCVTHLVTNSVRSVKYETATRYGMKVMHPDWIKQVWSKCQNNDLIVQADHEQFETFKLPALFQLCITSTGLKTFDRNQMKTLVEENGGSYNSSFTNKVDFLIMDKQSIGSDKFKAAKKTKKICLTPNWVYTSVEKGFAVPYADFEIHDPNEKTKQEIKNSTPTKKTNVTVSGFNPDNTQLSDISRITMFNPDFSLSETRASTRASTRPSTSDPGYKAVLTKITLPAAKKAGSVLDGLCFHLNGFTNEETQLIGKVLSFLGGTKMDNISDQVTHVIVGTMEPKLLSELEKHNVTPTIIKIEWLAKVIEEKRLVDEFDYQIERVLKRKGAPEKPSPASKKAMKSMSSTFKKPDIPRLQLDKKNDDVAENELLSQYLEKHDPVSESVEDEVTQDEPIKFLMGKYVYVHGFSDSSSGTVIIEACERVGAALVDNTVSYEVDYIITSSAILPKVDHGIKNFKQIVTDKWLEECTEAGECLDIQFHHRPLEKLSPGVKPPLKHEIFVVSNYKGVERNYIMSLVKILGGECLEVMKKSDTPIVISPNAEGSKYTSAMSWGFTVLNVEWLLQCHRKMERVDETDFLVGKSKPSKKNPKRRDSVVPSSQDPNMSNFDALDPPVENYADDDDESFKVPASNKTSTPQSNGANTSRGFNNSPHTPLQLNASRTTEHMSTPRRVLINKILTEGKNAREKFISPRRKRLDDLIDTPSSRKTRSSSTVDSPCPPLVACLKSPDKDYSLRHNTSLDTQWQHKRKMEGLDLDHIERPGNKKLRAESKVDETPPYSHRRYAMFEKVSPRFLSPEARHETANEASKFLNLNDHETTNERNKPPACTETDDDLRAFRELEIVMSSEKVKRPRSAINYEEDLATQKPEDAPFESEMLVEWIDPLDHDQFRNSKPVFAFNGLTEEEKRKGHEIITSLDATVDDKAFTHLLTQKPNKSEKYLISMARGGKIIQFDYLEACAEANKLIPEHQYELGNPECLESIVTQSRDNAVIFKAPYKWRNWIKVEHRDKFKDGAFTGYRFLMIPSSSKTSQVSNVILAGGGLIFESEFDEDSIKRDQINYCLVESAHALDDKKKKLLKSCKVIISNLNSILNYFLSENVPQGLGAQK